MSRAAPGRRTIVAMGGGGFQMEPDNPLLDDHVVGLAREHAREAGRDRPRICLIPTASTESWKHSAAPLARRYAS